MWLKELSPVKFGKRSGENGTGESDLKLTVGMKLFSALREKGDFSCIQTLRSGTVDKRNLNLSVSVLLGNKTP